MEIHKNTVPVAQEFLQRLTRSYWKPLRAYLENNPELNDTVTGFLLNHKDIAIYLGRTHIAIEYFGSEVLEEVETNFEMNFRFYDYSTQDCNLFEKIIGIEYDSTTNLTLPLPDYSEDLIYPTNKGWDKLHELGWNFAAQDSIMGFNISCPEVQVDHFSRVVNGMFFDANEHGLVTRHVKWIDFFPIHFDGGDSKTDSFRFNISYVTELVERDANFCYPLPTEYKQKQLPKLNRFIELWGNAESSEPDITSFLAENKNKFILTMKFGATDVREELICKWQSESKNDVKPDFFVIQPNGYADILEFKLPSIKNPVVGRENRETFSAWLNSYISQTRVYSSYFDDPNNRKWFEVKYGFKVLKPKRILVVGRRSDFDSDTWKEIISDFRDIEILTFDDLIDGVVVQFYKD